MKISRVSVSPGKGTVCEGSTLAPVCRFECRYFLHWGTTFDKCNWRCFSVSSCSRFKTTKMQCKMVCEDNLLIHWIWSWWLACAVYLEWRRHPPCHPRSHTVCSVSSSIRTRVCGCFRRFPLVLSRNEICFRYSPSLPAQPGQTNTLKSTSQNEHLRFLV